MHFTYYVEFCCISHYCITFGYCETAGTLIDFCNVFSLVFNAGMVSVLLCTGYCYMVYTPLFYTFIVLLFNDLSLCAAILLCSVFILRTH